MEGRNWNCMFLCICMCIICVVNNLQQSKVASLHFSGPPDLSRLSFRTVGDEASPFMRLRWPVLLLPFMPAKPTGLTPLIEG